MIVSSSKAPKPRRRLLELTTANAGTELEEGIVGIGSSRMSGSGVSPQQSVTPKLEETPVQPLPQKPGHLKNSKSFSGLSTVQI